MRKATLMRFVDETDGGGAVFEVGGESAVLAGPGWIAHPASTKRNARPEKRRKQRFIGYPIVSAPGWK
jgi:hypothetical protein